MGGKDPNGQGLTELGLLVNTLTLTARADLMRQTGFSFVEINSHLYDFEVNEGH